MSKLENTEIFTELLTTEEAAAYLNLRNKRTLDNWRSAGFGPRYSKIGRAVRYRRNDLIVWIEANTHQHTGEHAAA